MKRRRHVGKALTPAELVALGEQVYALFDRHDPARMETLHRVLAEHGHDPLDLFRARYLARLERRGLDRGRT